MIEEDWKSSKKFIFIKIFFFFFSVTYCAALRSSFMLSVTVKLIQTLQVCSSSVYASESRKYENQSFKSILDL